MLLLLSLLITSLAGSASSASSYILTDSFAGSNFFSQFDFATADGSNGFVHYVDQNTAQQEGLIGVDSNGVAFIRADSTNVADSAGRKSIRIESQRRFDTGLLIGDFAAMPATACGSWPAFWTYGNNWPNEGEIDVIEGVNFQTTNSLTLHTADGCGVDQTAEFTGTLQRSNCYVQAAGQENNAGCSVELPDSRSYGDGFNSAGGGVYATEVTNEYIAIWWFPRSSVPADIAAGEPNPANWGVPVARFNNSTCNIAQFFKNQRITLNINFCGDWAGNVWSSTPQCAALAGTCTDYVKNNPQAFAQQQWRVNYIHLYRSAASL